MVFLRIYFGILSITIQTVSCFLLLVLCCLSLCLVLDLFTEIGSLCLLQFVIDLCLWSLSFLSVYFGLDGLHLLFFKRCLYFVLCIVFVVYPLACSLLGLLVIDWLLESSIWFPWVWIWIGYWLSYWVFWISLTASSLSNTLSYWFVIGCLQLQQFIAFLISSLNSLLGLIALLYLDCSLLDFDSTLYWGSFCLHEFG